MAMDIMSLLSSLGGLGADDDQGQGGLGPLIKLLQGPDQGGPAQDAPVVQPQGAQASDPNAPAPVAGVDASVPAASVRQQGNTPGAIAPDMGNQRYLQQAQDALQQAPQHKGMFGVSGTLRDVLGTLGDAFLVQGDGKAVYQPKRQQERESDAQGGFTSDPMAAVERLSQVNPAMGQTLLNNLQERQVGLAGAKAKAANAASLEAERVAKIKQGLRTGLGGLFTSTKGDPEAYKQSLKVAQTALSRYGFDLKDDFGVDPDAPYDERTVKLLGAFGQSGRQVDATDQGQQRLDNQVDQFNQTLPITKQRADAATTSANRPAPNPTSASIAAPLLNKVAGGQPLTDGEEEVLKRAGYSKTKGDKKPGLFDNIALPPAAGGKGTSPAPSGGKYVFRNGKLVPK